MEFCLIPKALSSPSTVRQTFLRHLALLIALKRLRHPTELNLDFFEGTSHVENYRHFTALKRLKIIHDEHAFRLDAGVAVPRIPFVFHRQ